MKVLPYKCLIVVSFVFLLFSSCGEKEVKPIRYLGSYNRDFNDLNDLHLETAQKIGIDPVANRDEAEQKKGKLKKIESNGVYEIEDLTHSIPYLVPQAAKLLNRIGDNFADSLQSLNAPRYKLIITSITRTRDDIGQLRKRNGNSSKNSAHMYATTIDISWKRFKKDDRSKTDLSPEQLKMVLASVLRDLKKENACYVKHEKKQACFHITAR